ncbi:MAG: lipoprotein-releasing ABC transporter permease subunit [Deltaproteobacteria bacterium]|nr:lipoprotein-releasing ABC transporter permease subunit [Deltaproteobacteria bacterium]MBN2688111.1 lipoprotein-releasing ABC transporter permease subunit [Deltaproteobacteria bacterium]
MSYEFFIALRYLRAKRKQAFVSLITFISVAGIFLGVAALIIVLAVMNGFEDDLRNKILGVNSHIVLMKYQGKMGDYRSVKEKVDRIDGVVASTPFVYGQAMVKNGDRVTGVVLRGIDAESALTVISLGKMVAGSTKDLSRTGGTKQSLPGIVIGKELSKNMGVFLSDTVDVLSPMGIATPMGMVPRIKKFVVVGIFDSGFYEYDSGLVFLSLPECQNFLNMGEDVTGIEIRVRNIYKAKDIAETIEQELGFPYWARNWMQMNKNLFSALRLEKRVMFIILSLIVVVAAFNIITALIMVVMEKTRDIAILKSMGATSKSIMKIFMLQGIIIGAIGTALGCMGGLLVAFHIEPISLFVENIFGFKILPGDVYYLSELPSKVDFGDVLVIAAVAMIICFLATIYPSWNASKLDPAEALRYE